MAYLDEILDKPEFSEGWGVVDRRRDKGMKTVARALRAMLIAAILLALFNSAGLLRWTRDLRPTETSASIYALSSVWDARMQVHRFDEPAGVVHRHLENFRVLRWDDVRDELDTLQRRFARAFPATAAFAVPENNAMPRLRGRI